MGSGQERTGKYRDKVSGSFIGDVSAAGRGADGSGDRRTTWRPCAADQLDGKPRDRESCRSVWHWLFP